LISGAPVPQELKRSDKHLDPILQGGISLLAGKLYYAIDNIACDTRKSLPGDPFLWEHLSVTSLLSLPRPKKDTVDALLFQRAGNGVFYAINLLGEYKIYIIADFGLRNADWKRQCGVRGAERRKLTRGHGGRLTGTRQRYNRKEKLNGYNDRIHHHPGAKREAQWETKAEGRARKEPEARKK